MSYNIIGVLGDSIANGYFDEEGLGWFGRISQKIAKTFPHQYGFNNMSQAGDRVCDVYHRLLSEASSREIDILIFAVGVNDLTRRNSPNAPEDLSPLLRSQYWDRIFDFSKKYGYKFVVLDILPVIEEGGEQYDENGPIYYNFNKDIIEYNKLLKEKCQSKGILFIERFDNWQNKNLKDLYFDSLHPNAKGHQIIADEVYAALSDLKIIG